MGSEVCTLYNLLKFYKKTVVDTLNKIDTRLADVVNNYNSQTPKSSLKKYEIASHMASMLPHYVQMLHATEIMVADLLIKLNVNCDMQLEDKSLIKPFFISDVQQTQHPEILIDSDAEDELDVKVGEILEHAYPELDFSPIKELSSFETESHGLDEEIVDDKIMKNQSIEMQGSDVLESQILAVYIDIKEESVESVFRMSSPTSNTEIIPGDIEIKEESVENVSRSPSPNSDTESIPGDIEIKEESVESSNSIGGKEQSLQCQQTAQVETQPQNNIKTGKDEKLCTSNPVQWPLERNFRKSKKHKKNKKSKTKSNSQQCTKTILNQSEVRPEIKEPVQKMKVQDSTKTTINTPAVPLKVKPVQRVPENRRYNWREEVVKRLINENLKTTLTWDVSPVKHINKPKNEKRSRANCPIFEIPDDKLSVNQICSFAHIESPSEFYLLADQNQTLVGRLENSLNEDMNKQQYVINKYKSKEIAKNNLGKYCAAFLSDTRRWHRIEILDWMDEEPETVFVHLIDYGDKSYFSYKYIKNMSELYATIPKMAIRSHLAGIYSSHTQSTKWSTTSVDFFLKVSEIRKRTKFVVTFAHKEGKSYGVDLHKENDLNGDSLRQLLVNNGYASDTNNLATIAEEDCESCEREEEVPTENIPQGQGFTKVAVPPVGATVEILITGYVNTCHFYAHILYDRGSGLYNDDFEKLHQQLKMNNIVATYESFEIKPKIGELVLVKEQQQWFRGVCTVCDDNLEIFLVDFGHRLTKTMDNIRQMKEEFLNVPFQAVECVLDSCQERKTPGDISRDFFRKFMHMQFFQGVVIGCAEPLRVKLWDSDNIDMSQVLTHWGIGEILTEF